VGTECVVTVTAEVDGIRTNVGSTSFKVRKLPDPTPYIAYRDAEGNTARYKGSRPFPKGTLLGASGIHAAIDDGLLNIEFQVVSFETIVFDSMGNAIPEVSSGSSFSERQKNAFRRLQRGKRFIITRIKARGPDGITREISPMEVIVN
jgi:gliding motility-associated protein GldM